MNKPTLTEDPRLTNLFGTLTSEMRDRLRELLHDPQTHWDRDHGIILNAARLLTVWSAIRAVDPTFSNEGPQRGQRGELLRGWPRIPDSVLIARAIRYALEGGKVR